MTKENCHFLTFHRQKRGTQLQTSPLKQLRQLEELDAIRAFDQDVLMLRLLLGNRCFHFLNVVESAELG